jgi:hypothetical protein
VANTLGSGKTLLSAYPLEHYLAGVPAVFDKPEDTHQIYAAFRDWAGVKPVFHADRLTVEVSTLNGDRRGYVVLVNHSDKTENVKISTTVPARVVTRVLPEGFKAITMEGPSWRMDLGPYEGAIVEWKQ